MKILLVSSYLPYPLFSGGHIRLFNLLKGLSQNHQITLVCEKRNWQTEKDVFEVAKFCREVMTVPRKKQWSLLNILKTGFSTKPFLITGHTNSAIKKKIEEVLRREKFDLIHVETFYAMQNLPSTKVPVVLAEHNIEYLVYQRFAQITPFFLRPLLGIDILKMRYWEQKFWQKTKVLVAVSETDKQIMGRKNVFVVPNGVDLGKFRVQGSEFRVNEKEKRVLFIGDFRWIENRDSARWLLSEIWPCLKLEARSKKLEINLKLWIVGKRIPESIKKMGDESVIFDEKAPDEANLIYQKADLLLAPIRVGGGTKFKILEAMASGVLVVSSPLGVEGLGVKDGREVLIAKNSREFAGQILAILENPVKYQEIVEKARKLIEREYNWQLIVKKLEEAYRFATHD